MFPEQLQSTPELHIGQVKDSHHLKRKFCNFEDIRC
jgi:hypothetical protein